METECNLNKQNKNQDHPSKVAVAGAPGFLGTKLVEALLQQGREVTCLVHPSFKKNISPIFPAKEVTIAFMDILSPVEELAVNLTGI